jgi:AraC-like DNA-binding protein
MTRDIDCAMTAVEDEFQILRVSTDDVPERDRLEFVHEVYGRTIIKHDIKPLAGSSLYLRGSLRRLPGLGIASLVCSGVLTKRTPAQIENDDLVLNVNLGGDRVLRQLGREAVIREGEAVLSTSAEVGTCDIYENSRWISIRMPFNALAPMVADFDSVFVRPIAAGNEPLSLLVNYIGALQDTDALATPELHRLIVSHVYELVALTIGARSDAAEYARGHGLRAARRVKVLRLIEAGILSADLSAAAVARQLGVTPRYIHLLLEETGRTFSQLVLQKRLARAMELLRDPQMRARKIAEIAFDAGFADLSHFNRAFRRHFSDTPSGVRANAARGENDDTAGMSATTQN